MENLNKDNYFNAMQERYPAAMKEFCDWIDAYKIKVGWDVTIFVDANGKPTDVKFHDIPFEMQFGVLATYLCEKTGCQDTKHKHIRDMVCHDMEILFGGRQIELSAHG